MGTVHDILLRNNVMGFENVGGDIEMVTGKNVPLQRSTKMVEG